jgi:hypothetical protein
MGLELTFQKWAEHRASESLTALNLSTLVIQFTKKNKS